MKKEIDDSQMDDSEIDVIKKVEENVMKDVSIDKNNELDTGNDKDFVMPIESMIRIANSIANSSVNLNKQSIEKEMISPLNLVPDEKNVDDISKQPLIKHDKSKSLSHKSDSTSRSQ